MAKNEFRLENYTGSSQGQEAIRCWFRMKSGTADLFADKKRCGFCEENRCVLYNREEVEDVLHFLVVGGVYRGGPCWENGNVIG